MDPFATLGIERRYDIDLAAVEKRHRELSRALHPDRLRRRRRRPSASVALSKAVEVNEAWRIVRDPIPRAEALFTLAGIAVGERNEPKPSPALLDGDAGAARGARRGEGAERTSRPSTRCSPARCDARRASRRGGAARRASRARRRRSSSRSCRSLGELRFHRALPRRGERHRGRDRRAAVARRPEHTQNHGPPRNLRPQSAPAAHRHRPRARRTRSSPYVKNERPVAIADCDQEVLLPSVVSYAGEGDVVVGRGGQRLARRASRATRS